MVNEIKEDEKESERDKYPWLDDSDDRKYVTDKLDPYHVKEEDKRILDKEMKRLCYLGILKEDLSAYSSPVMLISRKVTQDKRVVTDFRHFNTRIAKNN